MSDDDSRKVRLDKWLWAARFFKTRALAAEAIAKGRVTVNGTVAKASREPKVGDEIAYPAGHDTRTVRVLGLSAVRGGAPQAALLYAETEASLAARQHAAERRRLAPEPAHALEEGRPTKRDRRQLQAWDDRWRASAPR